MIDKMVHISALRQDFISCIYETIHFKLQEMF